jgi:hypothetical protein
MLHCKPNHPWSYTNIVMCICPENRPIIKKESIKEEYFWFFFISAFSILAHVGYRICAQYTGYILVYRNKLSYGPRYDKHFTRSMSEIPIIWYGNRWVATFIGSNVSSSTWTMNLTGINILDANITYDLPLPNFHQSGSYHLWVLF